MKQLDIMKNMLNYGEDEELRDYLFYLVLAGRQANVG
jgi:hypothetical protein